MAVGEARSFKKWQKMADLGELISREPLNRFRKFFFYLKEQVNTPTPFFCFFKIRNPEFLKFFWKLRNFEIFWNTSSDTSLECSRPPDSEYIMVYNKNCKWQITKKFWKFWNFENFCKDQKHMHCNVFLEDSSSLSAYCIAVL